MSGSEINQDMDAGSEPEHSNLQADFFKVKHVFDLLIEEASYLISEKAFKTCEGKSNKEKFLIMVDSIRNSLSIDDMKDIQLLVDIFYEYGPKKQAAKEKEEAERKAAREEELKAQLAVTTKSKKDKENQAANTAAA